MARPPGPLARDADNSVSIFAQTPPRGGASTAVLRKSGFTRTGTAHDDEAGEVWEWQMPKSHLP